MSEISALVGSIGMSVLEFLRAWTNKYNDTGAHEE